MIPVTVRLGSTTWKASPFPKGGCYLVPLKDAARTAEGLADGDEAGIVLEVW